MNAKFFENSIIPDDELVARFKIGNKVSFVLLLDRYKKGIYNMMYRMTQNQADAEDLTQDVFLKVYTNLDEFRGESSFKTWIYRIALNLYLNIKKSSRYNKEVLSEDMSFFYDSKVIRIDSHMEQTELSELVKIAIENLPDQQKTTLILRLEKELKNKEIAQILECSEGTVKANIFHALNNVRRKLRELGYEFYQDEVINR
jgi:RNA polymerase sigma-70 factor, ECF subfamily